MSVIPLVFFILHTWLYFKDVIKMLSWLTLSRQTENSAQMNKKIEAMLLKTEFWHDLKLKCEKRRHLKEKSKLK